MLADLSAQSLDSLAIPVRKGASESSRSGSSNDDSRNSNSFSDESGSRSSKSEQSDPKSGHRSSSTGRTSSEQSSSSSSNSRSASAGSVSSSDAEDSDEKRSSSNRSFYETAAFRAPSRFGNSSSSAGNSASRGSESRTDEADVAAVNSLRFSDSSSHSSSDARVSSEDPGEEQNDNRSADENASGEETGLDGSATELAALEAPIVQGQPTPQMPYAATQAVAPRPNLYISQPEEKPGLLSRIFGRRRSNQATTRIPTNFTSDYTKRDPGVVLPAVLAGNGLNGKDIPIGSEDQYRLASALPTDFRPTDLVQIPIDYCHYGNQLYLRREAAASLCKMIYDAQCQGLNIEVVSAFRDYGHQLRLYNQSVARRGADQKAVARPGRSEHFLGTTVDLTNSEEHALKRSFGDTAEGRWLAANAHRYGWKMTVMSSNARRSHNDEPWHLRYLGSAVNTYSRNSAIAQTQPQPQRRDIMGSIGRFLGLRR